VDQTQLVEQRLFHLDPSGPAVVAIGGGHGLAQALVAAQRYASSIDAVVTVADDGGSSGRLTYSLGIPPPGDLRMALLALAPTPSLWREVFAFRFQGSDVVGHSLGNLVLAALSELFLDTETALAVAGEALGALGRVLPASLRSLRMFAKIDGKLVEGQSKITTCRGRIEELRLMPEAEPANPAALEAIHGADQIIIGPGSLYTSVIAALLVPGMADAINASSGKVAYVGNLITQDGETLGMDASSHLDALCEMTGLKAPGVAILNRRPLQVELPPLQSEMVVDEEAIRLRGVKPVLADLVDTAAAWPQHDPLKLGEVLASLV
jgi:uncharacterized cofD-like protein